MTEERKAISSPPMTNTLVGKCFCGAVAYTVADEFSTP